MPRTRRSLAQLSKMELFGELAVRESGRPVLLPGEVEVRVCKILSRRRVGGTLAQSMPSVVPADPSSCPHPAAHGADHQPVRPGQKGARGRQHHCDVAPYSVGGPGAHVPSIVPFLARVAVPEPAQIRSQVSCMGCLLMGSGGCIGMQEGVHAGSGRVPAVSRGVQVGIGQVQIGADACIQVAQRYNVEQG